MSRRVALLSAVRRAFDPTTKGGVPRCRSQAQHRWGFPLVLLLVLGGCSEQTPTVGGDQEPLPPTDTATSGGGAGGAPPVDSTPVPTTPPVVRPPSQDEPEFVDPGDGASCEPISCAELGWACGYLSDACDNLIDCADEGLECASGDVCIGGIDGPTECAKAAGGGCELCSYIPSCEGQPQTTQLTGRVVTPGRSDGDVGNQVGVPNALVYILQVNTSDGLPEIPSGIPSGGSNCDRCEDQEAQLGPVLFGAVTDATGTFTIEEYVPVGTEFTLVVKAGKFRRAVRFSLPETAACQTTALPTTLPDNPTRLPRDLNDGLFVNLPRIAVSTGQIDAMECVFEKMGISHAEFGNPGADGTAAQHIHLYRGGPLDEPAGAVIDDTTPHDTELYTVAERLQSYDMIVADCEGPSYDQDFEQRDASGANLLEYVNRGGRVFASHLSFSWLHENGDEPYDEADPHATGLAAAAEWDPNPNSNPRVGTGSVAIGRPNASPRIDNFAAWLVNEGVVVAPEYAFDVAEPRSQVSSLGEFSEEFIYCDDSNDAVGAADAGVPEPGDCRGQAARTQQFSFNTPYAAPEAAACGRVAYSGFHIAAEAGGGSLEAFANVAFPEHCSGDLTDQEKVLLYMLFDLGSCVGDPPEPPECTPSTCESLGASCGRTPDGCGGVLDCGACTVDSPR